MGNAQQLPGRVQWTPLRQACGCVIDWGWNSEASPPPTFISWCTRMVATKCPRHGKDKALALDMPGTIVDIRDPASEVTFHARMAIGDDVPLGEQLAGELCTLREQVTDDPLSVLAQIPANYRNWLRKQGYDPLEAWMDQRLIDIVCNRGSDTLSPELLAALPEQVVLDCELCEISTVMGGVLCVCGHDWGCHPTETGGREPCSHCACQDMATPAVSG